MDFSLLFRLPFFCNDLTKNYFVVSSPINIVLTRSMQDAVRLQSLNIIVESYWFLASHLCRWLKATTFSCMLTEKATKTKSIFF